MSGNLDKFPPHMVSEEFFEGALATHKAVKAVLALHHTQGGYMECVECGYESPCPTVTTINKELGR